jgi:hypothetical protein
MTPTRSGAAAFSFTPARLDEAPPNLPTASPSDTRRGGPAVPLLRPETRLRPKAIGRRVADSAYEPLPLLYGRPAGISFWHVANALLY